MNSTENQTEVAVAGKRPHIFRRLYLWVLSWANSRYGPAALFGIAVLESSVFPIPPDVLLIPLCLGKAKKSFHFAAICTLGSVLGGLLGYVIGAGFWELTQGFFIPHVFSQEKFEYVQSLYMEHDFWVIFIAAFTPIPYKVITITAGVADLAIIPFLIASAVGRAGRFFLVAGLIWRFGPPIARFIDKYFEWLAVAFVILLVGAFYLLKFIA